MKVLMLSTDKNILDKNSEVGQRMVEYGRLVEKLDILLVQKSNIFNVLKKGKKMERPDLITAQDPFETGFVGWRLAKYFKTKLQLQVHTDFLSPYFKKESMKNRVRVWLAKFLIPKADCIRVVSDRIRESLKAKSYKLKAEPFVLPIWVDIEKIRNAPIKTDPPTGEAGLHKKYPQFDFIILMASRLTKEKNIELAIDVIKEFPKVGLIIVGDGPMKKNYELRIKNYENIKLESWTDDLASYYKTCDLFLLTSNYEGYGMTLVEAAAAGCKIISSDVGVADEILEKENIFKVGDREDLKKKITSAIQGLVKPPKPIKLKTKEEYLKEYKQNWTSCL